MPPAAQQSRPLLFSFALTKICFNEQFFARILEEIS